MSFFKRLLGLKSKKSAEENNADKNRFMPTEKPPIDELFMINFKKNGGKFIYCENKTELLDNFDAILQENNWKSKPLYSHQIDKDQNFLKDLNLDFTTDKNVEALVSNCEYLIANTGAIMVCAKQIGEGKLSELPHNFIVYATTSQLLESLGEGLQLIKKKHQSKIPASITTLKTFEEKTDSDFLSYGSTQKNLYLLLLEDL
ncbi:LUD domain-containing protein [Flavobacterium sp. CS20]|jgi:L-lactate utilization protein LutC|uniref:LUD domain-containing protein n=1 Tax=Flavobacterium sp. CS20 TaxID=2775246 RepID=UPI001B3A3995|nr:LUD domain-containing protein [Flavobacterium sp. CS20]QTY27222.1 lactate utilization protein B/C [Flavobacterium sp. CS20]